MKAGILAQRYARALFAVALERQQLEAIRREYHEVVATIEENRALDVFLSSPQNSRAEKRQALTRVFQGRCSAIVFNFLLLLAAKGRIGMYREIHQALQRLYDKHHRKLRALAISAVPMTRSELEALQADLAQALKMQLEIENRVDPGILGGVILNLDGRILDASVRLQLQRLRETLYRQRN
ncbi:MAG: ATP synthase F1 subunit delta [candidate division KSB1 bacterium]|nr:ATP synthase F1 subunit delta [candidate division KSB1 bacterium]MDZ7273054.1 ATP synthase F1 subunit delta [candidate division KSB1 bacterium]MDZ7285157.1 ATP synthase F1 subunit delta [candidate division KSB1 bacterium]MDZ7298189.1 ATP synthase F1 subunit delta [candidate division KSB1 bacterium]MDZ7307854.1 ATP synthase F1 subunit delta [candidate division KSB1 bacterium]